MRTIIGKTFAAIGAILGLAAASPALADMGRSAGTYGVSPSGAATYTIPIWVQPGPKSLQPSLAITYNSQAGNGTMGVGWGISGFSSIERCAWTVGEDGMDQAISVTANDRFCMGGNKLRVTSGPLSTYGTAGAVYQTQIANFSRITSVGTAGTGPQSFVVHSKDGLIYEYGSTPDSRFIVTGSTVFRWFLNKVSDRDGNSYVITYSTDNTVGRVPLSVQWGNTTANGSTYQYQATFNYTNKTVDKDIIWALEQGYSNPTKQRLNNIQIGYSASGSSYATKRQYVFTYVASPTTSQSRLTQIKECADTTSNCLKPTAIGYQNGVAGVNTSPTTALSSPGGGTLAGKYDFNGDGRSDLAYFNGSTWRVAFSNGSSFSTGVDTGITGVATPVASRFVSTHQDGFLVNVGGNWSYVGFNGVSFTTTATGIPVNTGTTGAVLSDNNGDGLADLLWSELSGSDGLIKVRLNTTTGNATVPTFSATPFVAFSISTGPAGNVGNLALLNISKCPTERQCDINGDGRPDLAANVTTISGCGGPSGCTATQALYDMVSSGSGYIAVAVASGVSAAYTGIRFNDDRCTDKIPTNSTTMGVASCTAGGATTAVTIPAIPVTVLDWDGDGNTDLLVNNGGTIGVYVSKGNTASPFNSLLTTSITYSSSCVYFVADVEGDGLDELACASTASPFAVTYYTHKGGGSVGAGGGVGVFATQVPDLANNITDGYGVAVSPAYVSLAQSNYTRGTGTTLPLVDANDAIYAVGRLTVSDGIGTSYDLNYTYKGARRNGALGVKPSSWYPTNEKLVYKPESDGQWAGFEQISVVDSRSTKLQLTTYDQLFPLDGMIKQSDEYQSDQTSLISRTSNTNVAPTLDSTANNKRYFPNASQTAVDRYEVGGALNAQLISSFVRTVAYADLTYGNPTTITTVGTDKDSSSTPSSFNNTWTTTANFTYDTPLASGSDWCVNFTTQSQIVQSSTAPGATTVTRTVGYSADSGFPSKCRVKVRTTEPSSTRYKVTETLGFDSFGNVSSKSVVGRQPIGGGAFGDMPARNTSVDWGSTGQFPMTVTDPTTATSTFAYNFDTGTLQKATDPNLLDTSFQYDAFNRETRETRPDGTYTTWAYADCATAGCVSGRHVLTIVESGFDRVGALVTDSYQYLDAYERNLVSRSRLLSGVTWDGSYQWLESDYDALGRKFHAYIPCKSSSSTTSCAGSSTSYSYDALNRLTQASRPRNATDNTPQSSSYGYAGRTETVTDALGKPNVRVLNVNGSIHQIRDANNFAVNFTHDAAGSVIGVTDSTPSTRLSGVTVDYGIEAFLVASTDSARGQNTQTFNSLGEIVAWTDAKGQTFSATYDNLSRPLTRVEPGALPGDPLVTSTITWGTSAVNHNIGQLTSMSQTANGQTYLETKAFDGLGRLQTNTIQIPEASGPATYTYGHAYEVDKGWLDTLEYPVSTGGYRHKLKYAYQNGIVQKVADANSSTVYWSADTTNARGQTTQETLGSGIVLNRSFDAITSWITSVQAGVGGNPTSLQSQSYLYDLAGNVTQRQNNKLSLTESYFYGSASDNLYRIEHSSLNNGSTTTTNLLQTYDASGNILTKNEPGLPDQLIQQAITWTSYNYPQQITTQNESATFAYGPNRERWKMSFTSSGKPDETTYYIGGLLEKVVVGTASEYRHTIYGGTGPVAIYSRLSNGTDTLRYVLEDNQGSAETIANSSGGLIANESFTAYGERRNAATWVGPPANLDRETLDGITRQGYTYQTVLGSMGLNHMNGRVQDAVNGRFLSADPFITHADYTQNYNRYAYVYNNPATFTDPTGFDTLCGAGSLAYDPNTNRPISAEDQRRAAAGGLQNGSTTGTSMQYVCRPAPVSEDPEGVTVTGTRGERTPAQYIPPQDPVKQPGGPGIPTGPGGDPKKKPAAKEPEVYETEIFVSEPCKSWGSFFNDNNESLGMPTSGWGTGTGTLAALRTAWVGGTSVGTLPAGALLTTAPTAVAWIGGALELGTYVTAAAFVGTQIGSVIVATTKKATCTE